MPLPRLAPPLALALALAGAAAPARAQEGPQQAVVEWLLDVGKAYREAGPHQQLVLFRRLWTTREQHPDRVTQAAAAIAEHVDGELGRLYRFLAEAEEDPFAPSDPGAEDAPALLVKADDARLGERLRAYVRFLRALDHQGPDLERTLARLKRPQHPWLRELRALAKLEEAFAGHRERFAALELPGLPDGLHTATRVRVWTGDWERPADGDPSPVTIDGWLVADRGDAVDVYTDYLGTRTYALGAAEVPADVEAFAPGPLPSLEELTWELAVYDRLGRGVEDYADRAAHAAAGGLDFAQETLLWAFYAFGARRPTLALRLYALAVAAEQQEGGDAEALWAGLAAAADAAAARR